jgi:hypothetical protein
MNLTTTTTSTTSPFLLWPHPLSSKACRRNTSSLQLLDPLPPPHHLMLHPRQDPSYQPTLTSSHSITTKGPLPPHVPSFLTQPPPSTYPQHRLPTSPPPPPITTLHLQLMDHQHPCMPLQHMVHPPHLPPTVLQLRYTTHPLQPTALRPRFTTLRRRHRSSSRRPRTSSLHTTPARSSFRQTTSQGKTLKSCQDLLITFT